MRATRQKTIRSGSLSFFVALSSAVGLAMFASAPRALAQGELRLLTPYVLESHACADRPSPRNHSRDVRSVYLYFDLGGQLWRSRREFASWTGRTKFAIENGVLRTQPFQSPPMSFAMRIEGDDLELTYLDSDECPGSQVVVRYRADVSIQTPDQIVFPFPAP